MFCSKCGTKAIDGADFCQKCGARLVKDDSVSPVPETSPQKNTIPNNANTASADTNVVSVNNNSVSAPNNAVSTTNSAVQSSTSSQSADQSFAQKEQEAYTRLTESSANFPKIKNITIQDDPRHPTAKLFRILSMFCGYVYDPVLGTISWNIRTRTYIFYVLSALPGVILANVAVSDYNFGLALFGCLLILAAGIIFDALSYAEAKKITNHINITLDKSIVTPIVPAIIMGVVDAIVFMYNLIVSIVQIL